MHPYKFLLARYPGFKTSAEAFYASLSPAPDTGMPCHFMQRMCRSGLVLKTHQTNQGPGTHSRQVPATSCPAARQFICDG